VGALVVAGALGAATYSESSTLRDRRADLETLRVELAANPAPPAPPAWVGRVQGAQAQRSTALGSALAQRLWWDRIVSETAAVLPQGVWLTRVDGSAPDAVAAAPAPVTTTTTTTTPATPDAAPAPAPGPVAPAAGAPTSELTVEGLTASHELVADLLARLSVVPDFATVSLQSSAISTQPSGGNPIEFRILVGLRAPGASS